MPIGRVELSRLALDAGLQEFGEYLRDRRVRVLRLTQAEIAARAGLNQSSISRIETGHHPRDKAAALALAQAYQLSTAMTKGWLELLYGSTSLFGADDESDSWGSRLEYAYTLLERLRDNHAPSYKYFYPPPCLSRHFPPASQRG